MAKIKEQMNKRSTISISVPVLEKANTCIKELNIQFENFEKKSDLTANISSGKTVKKGIELRDTSKKLTIKTFTEAALLHFVKYKIDPRFYEDESIPTAINRLRNQLFAFLQVQERQIILPFQQDISQLKLHIPETVEATAMETQGTLMGLLYVLFEMLQVDKKEQIRLEQLLQQKGIEFIESIQK